MCGNILRFCHRWTNRNIVVYFVWYHCSPNFDMLLRRNNCVMVCDRHISNWGWWTALHFLSLVMMVDIVEVHFGMGNFDRLMSMMVSHMVIFPLRETNVLFWFDEGLIFPFTSVNLVALNNFGFLETWKKVGGEALTKTIPQTRLKVNFGIGLVLYMVPASKNAFLRVERSFAFFLFACVDFFQSFFIRLHFE